MSHLLEVKNLQTQFTVDRNVVKAVDGVSYYVDEGEIVAVVGESGSGKSVTQYSGIQLIPTPPGKIVGGEVLFNGKNLLQLSGEELRQVRGGDIGVVFQEPMTSLNPVLTIGYQIIETIILHLKMNKKDARKHAIELLKSVGIPDAEARIDYYPHQFSGGMRQRVCIAMAMACNPKILIADEATTALDVTTQAQILEMLKDIVKKTKTSVVMVTHNLGIVARYADRIYVMYAGEIVESGTTKEIFSSPKHPYTISLLNAIPRLDDPKGRQLIPIDGIPPSLINKQDICAFLPRCPHRTAACSKKPAPRLQSHGGNHYAACHEDVTNKSLLEVATGSVTLMDAPVEQKKMNETLLEVKNLKMYFPVMKGVFKRKVADVKAVDDVSFSIKKGETLGLVGESGCGKTTIIRSILRMYEPTSGEVIFDGQNIAKMPKNKLRPIRRNISLVFQDPFSSLDPRQTAGSIVGEPLIIHKLTNTKEEYEKRVDELFELVGLNPAWKNRVPHEFSGGQRQRIGIARALASNPSFIVCDEAISALDVSIQAQIINLLEDLQKKLGLTYLFVAHDLSVVRHISDRVVVMYLGKIVEVADWKSLYENPLHPYTKGLLAAVPIPDPFVEENREHVMLEGEIPSVMNRPKGCAFFNRCPMATKECSEVEPPLVETDEGHSVACIKVGKEVEV
ncbi:glutathione ABC transporter ATP-binding protein [Bacillus sp. MUM 116]|uniref:dipeptide ABC transporter ATP-binding protein n=1 Tax=Bacillus sp. MUM 116 TaxID=1678002 RepID=UPI0008F5AA66|nr:ABC transporter ATP-binding protein [Bacillus sp. MUM 116]OIK08865.1 glutathione ABC transporter ATP-binding protein [Bacillus sp. MUM 116]